MRTKGRRRGSGPAREMYKGADDKTEVPAYQMLQCKLSARPRLIRPKLPRETVARTFFFQEIKKKVIRENREVESRRFLREKGKISVAFRDRREKSLEHNNRGVRSMREDGTLRRPRLVLHYPPPDGPPGAAGPAQTRYRS